MINSQKAKQRKKPFLSSLMQRAEKESLGLPELVTRAEKLSNQMAIGIHQKKKSGSGEFFWQFRQYTQSDDQRDIDWRRSAKGDDLYVREKELQTAQTVMIWAQQNESMDFRSRRQYLRKQDCAHILGLAIAHLGHKAGEKIRVFGNSHSSDRTFESFAKSLHSLQTDALPNPQNDIRSKNVTAFLIGDFLSPIEDIERRLSVMQTVTPNIVCIQILDEAEIELPYKGRVLFHRGNRSETALINDVASVQNEYKKRMDNHIQSLKNSCKKYGYEYVLFPTNTDMKSCLLDIYQRLSAPDHHKNQERRA